MAGSLQGKTAVITGSTRGIGLGFARALAAEGCAIMLNGFGDTAEIEEIRAGLAAAFAGSSRAWRSGSTARSLASSSS